MGSLAQPRQKRAWLWWILPLASIAALLSPALAGAGHHASKHHQRSTVTVSRLGAARHPGEQLSLQGRVRHLPAGAKVGLQERPGTSGAWTTVARTRRIEHGSFTLRWTVPQKSGLTLQLRAVALRHGRVLAASKPQIDPLAPPPTACAPPPKPGMVPLGDGVVQGGLYWEGGPAPGQGPNCWSRAYAVSATDSRGKVMATQEVAAGNGYTLILPAGSYTLTAGGCHDNASVTAGAITQANVVCAYP